MIELILAVFLIAVIGVALLVSIANQTAIVNSAGSPYLASLPPTTSCVSCTGINSQGVNTKPEMGVCVSTVNAGTVTNLTFTMKKGTAPVGAIPTISAKIYSATGSPSGATCGVSSTLGISSTTITYTSLTTSFAQYAFLFSGVTLSKNQNILVVANMTFAANACTTTCFITFATNAISTPSQSNVDNFVVGATGPPGAPANQGDNFVCVPADSGCVGYFLNGNIIATSSPAPGLQGVTTALDLFAIGIVLIFMTKKIEGVSQSW